MELLLAVGWPPGVLLALVIVQLAVAAALRCGRRVTRRAGYASTAVAGRGG